MGAALRAGQPPTWMPAPHPRLCGHPWTPTRPADTSLPMRELLYPVLRQCLADPNLRHHGGQQQQQQRHPSSILGPRVMVLGPGLSHPLHVRIDQEPYLQPWGLTKLDTHPPHLPEKQQLAFLHSAHNLTCSSWYLLHPTCPQLPPACCSVWIPLPPRRCFKLPKDETEPTCLLTASGRPTGKKTQDAKTRGTIPFPEDLADGQEWTRACGSAEGEGEEDIRAGLSCPCVSPGRHFWMRRPGFRLRNGLPHHHRGNHRQKLRYTPRHRHSSGGGKT